MPSQTEHALMLSRLLPQGPAWAPSDETDGDNTWTKLLNAFSYEPARVDAAALLLLEQIIPDNANTDLDAWERIVGAPDEDLTDAERLARIQSYVYGRRRVNRGYLEDVVQAMAGNEDVRLFNRVGPRACTGELTGCGDRLRSGEWDFTYLCELMPNLLGVAFDAFTAWTGFSATSDAAATSPVTLLTTADQVTVPNATYGSTPLVGTADGDTVYASLWIFVSGSGTQGFKFGFLGRDNVASETTFTIVKGVWHKLSHEASIGTGATAPLLRLKATSGTPVTRLSWAVAGARDSSLEARVHALFPIHTTGHFGVVGEYETLLANEDPTEVSW